MRELSLFTGAGGGVLGSVLLGHTIVGAVEIEPEPCKSLYQRQLDGILEPFPIWNIDLREFNERIACVYTGLVDLVSGGFPCQDISCAGKGARFGWVSAAVAWSCLLMTDLAALIK